ncbi:GDSL esterase/lipase At5g42170-like [Rutidosis leptorrhynchoides]|uniref:GDSL esterase/lipase At5g42170-like n=1 Tax=Rutidosis leptorrhynchoides TaxID=125765 RepID=UPI003A98FBE8
MKVMIMFCVYASLYFQCNNGATNLPKDVVVPAVIAFGDSVLDPGNNNYINTVTKANFPPYGKDFIGRKPTGRFGNGKIISDFLAKALGVKEYVPAYLDPSLQDKDLLMGVSFASAGSGYDPLTSTLASVIPLAAQLDMFKDYIEKLKRIVGEEAAKNIITNSVYFISASTNDFLTNYYSYRFRRLQYDLPAYCNKLAEFATSSIQELHKLGARRIIVFSSSTIGCIPFERTVHGGPNRKCVHKYNKAAQVFNDILKEHLQILSSSFPESRIASLDFYNPMISIMKNPRLYGLDVVDEGCCGTRNVEMGYFCNMLTKLCKNDSKFFFWDSLHPSEKGSEILTNLVVPELMKSLFY